MIPHYSTRCIRGVPTLNWGKFLGKVSLNVYFSPLILLACHSHMDPLNVEDMQLCIINKLNELSKGHLGGSIG